MNALKSGLKILAALCVAILAVGTAPKSEAATFLYSAGHCMNTSELSGNGDTAIGTLSCGGSYVQGFNNDDATWAFALSGGYGAFDAIVTGESTPYSGLSGATYAAINAYISGGGRVIVGGAHGPEVSVLNAITGYAAYNSGLECGSEFAHTSITAAAAGTSFAGGPATLNSSSCTSFMAGLPGTAVVFYEHTFPDAVPAGSSAMFMSTYGAGLVGAYGFDSCCGSPADDSDWYDVLHAALVYSPTATDVPAPGALALLGLGLIGVGGMRRKKLTA